jgi:hypothetical protein
MKTKPAAATSSFIYNSSILRAGILIAVLALLVIPLFSSSSASSSEQLARPSEFPVSDQPSAVVVNQRDELVGLLNGANNATMPALLPMFQTGSIETFDGTCTTPKTTFELGDTVCAKATGLVGFRFAWMDAAGYIEKRTNITSDPQTDTFTLPTSQTSQLPAGEDENGNPLFVTVDNRGQWRVSVITSRSSVKSATFTTVTDPNHAIVDLSIVKSFIGDSPVAGGQVQFAITVRNNGPNDAADVHFLDDTFTNATLSSVAQTSGPAFTCESAGGTVDCSIATLTNGSEATFTLNFTAGSAGSSLSNTASVTSTTAEQNNSDNSSTAGPLSIGTGAAPPACDLECPQNINAIADTEENSVRGAHVTYAAPTGSGTCGVITTSPSSGSFFPVGTTTVVASSEEGNGSCSFTITVTDTGTNPPTISCPANQSGTANSSCEAAITVGTATATGGSNVTRFAQRSDGKPMYTCDEFGNCTRNSSDAPFAAGTTTITWFAFSHDVAGPYNATTGDEESHRNGAASCTQTITVDDVTPPTINAPPQTVAADATCQAPVPDYSNTATDNCACASSDESEACEGRQDIVVTQSIAAGTLLGPGTYTITLTANDGSSNNGGAGNTTTTTTTFTVVDQTAPEITCPGNVTTSTDPGSCSATLSPGTATATDNCDSSVTIVGVRSDSQPLNAPYPKGTTTITWTATDDANNSSSCTQTITVNDTEAPAISCPSNITRNNDPGVCGAVVTYTAPVGTDNCPGATTVQTAGLASGSTFPVGTTTNTFEVTDASGNKTSCSFTVTVNDAENPVISCPSNIVLEPSCPSGAIATWTAPVGTDNCPGAVTTRTAGPAPGSVFPIGTTTVTYTVNDAHGNSTSCSFTVTVKTVTQTINDLKASVNASSLNGSQKQGLISKLDAALQHIQSGNQNGACSKLSDFINSTQTFISHGDISAAVGNAWISTANHVRNTIGCTSNPCT